VDDERVRERLVAEKERIEHEIHEFEVELGESSLNTTDENPYDQHMADVAGPTLAREVDLTLEDNARSVNAQITRALAKLETGSYGRCDSCGISIDEERLAIVPWATLCIDCRRRAERSR
jgi:DnaK suppressor protein